jgi:hypothetical protein
MTSHPHALYKLAKKAPIIVLLRCPTWKLLAILGDEYSMMSFLPLPRVFVPYGEGQSFWVRSCTWVRMLRMRVEVVSWKWRKALSWVMDAT